jgi:superfamily II DNA/RNA helicase
MLPGGVFSPKDEKQKLAFGSDFIVAKPGRFIDHLKTAKKFSPSTIEKFLRHETGRFFRWSTSVRGAWNSDYRGICFTVV